MLSPLKTRDRKKHTLLGLANFEEWGSSGFRTKKLKREDGVKQWTGKPREHCERVEPDLEPVRLVRKTMDARVYKKRQLRKDESPGSYGVSNGTGTQVLPLAPDIVNEEEIRSHDMQKSVEGSLLPDILDLCQVLQLPENVKVMVGKFLEYVISKHEVTREPETMLEAFRISLCWNAASLVKYKIDKKESLSLAKRHLIFGCSVEELSDVDSTLRKLRKTFAIDVGNVKESDSSKHCVSAIKETTKDQEQQPKSRIEEKEFLRCTKRADKKLEKRMKKLARKQQKEIDEFHRIWGKRKVQIQEQHCQRFSLVSSGHNNSAVKLNELKLLDDELEKKMEEHKNQRKKRLQDLTAHHLAKKSKEIGKKGRWFEETKSSGQVKKSYMMPSGNNAVANMTSFQELPNERQSNVEEAIEGARKVLVGDLHRSGNDSENYFAAKSPSSEEQLRNEPPSSVEEVIKFPGFGLVPGLDGSGNTSQACSSQNNFANNMPSSEVQLRNEPPSIVEEVIKSPGFGLVPGLDGSGNTSHTCSSQNNFATNMPSSNEQLRNEPPSSVEEVIKSPGFGLVPGLDGSGYTSHTCSSQNNFATNMPSSDEQLRIEPPSSVEEVMKSPGFGLVPGLDGFCNTSQTCSSQNNFATNMPSTQVQLPLGDSPSVKEATKGAASELLSTCAQMAITEAPARKDGVQIPTEAGTSDQNVNELVLTNPSKRQQQQPSADISVDTNQPTSASPSPSPSLGSDHGLVLAMTNENQPNVTADTNQPTSASIVERTPADISVDTNQPTSPSPSPSPSLGIDHGLVLAMTIENQPNVTADTNQPTSASIVEQTPASERPVVSINVEPPQEAHNPQLPVDTNHFHPVPASVAELAPSTERPIVSLNAEASRQLLNSRLSPDQSNLGPDFSPTNESSRPNQTEPRVANNNNDRLVVDTPVLPHLVNSRPHMETPPSINSFMGDLRSHPMLQGARQATPQITAQRLTSNPIYNEYERLCRESERVVEVHEYMKLQLNSDCEKELAEVRKKYDLKLQDAEASFSVKKKELDINSMNVLMNGLYAQSFQNMAEYIDTFKLPQEISPNLTQQVHLPHPQAHPIFSPSTFNSSATVLSACSRPNSPHIMNMLTPRPNFRANFIQSSPLLQHFRPQPPFSATSFASVSQRAPAQREVPRHPTFQPSRLAIGPRAATRGCYPSLENPNLSRSAFFINLQNQMATPSSVSRSVPASGSNLGLLSQVMGDNRGASGRTNMVNSGGMTGFICLSDDE